MKNACKCRDISIEQINAAVKDGAKTLEAVMEKTKAGTGCGRCKKLLTNIIENEK